MLLEALASCSWWVWNPPSYTYIAELTLTLLLLVAVVPLVLLLLKAGSLLEVGEAVVELSQPPITMLLLGVAAAAADVALALGTPPQTEQQFETLGERGR